MSSHELTLHAAEEQKNEDKALFGFWVYIMTDCVLFGTLFAVYAVLHGNTFGGPSGADLFKLPYIMIETLLLLTSSYEASPTVVKEALRALRPVVSTDVGDVADWLERDRTGYVCEAHPEALAAGIRAASRLIVQGCYQASSRMHRLDEGRLMSDVLTLYRQLAAR